jgi:hypothetical protein
MQLAIYRPRTTNQPAPIGVSPGELRVTSRKRVVNRALARRGWRRGCVQASMIAQSVGCSLGCSRSQLGNIGCCPPQPLRSGQGLRCP